MELGIETTTNVDKSMNDAPAKRRDRERREVP